MDEFNEGDRVRLIADECDNFEDYGLEIGMFGEVVGYAGVGEITVLVDGFEKRLDFFSSELGAV